MDLVARIKQQYTLKDLEAGTVEAVSVVALDDLEAVLAEAVRQKVAETGGGGLEHEAAQAALEAEARALEAKAEADQRAQAAEARVSQLESKLAELESSGGAGAAEAAAATQALESKLKELEGQLATARADQKRAESLGRDLEAAKGEKAALQKERDELQKQLAAAQEELKKAGAGAAEGDDGGPPAPVTDSDRTNAKRLAEAFLDDVFSEDEERTRQAIKDGKFREVFARELKSHHRQYIKRVKAHVRAEKDYWEDTLTRYLLKSW